MSKIGWDIQVLAVVVIPFRLVEIPPLVLLVDKVKFFLGTIIYRLRLGGLEFGTMGFLHIGRSIVGIAFFSLLGMFADNNI